MGQSTPINTVNIEIPDSYNTIQILDMATENLWIEMEMGVQYDIDALKGIVMRLDALIQEFDDDI